ncbi:MAG: hypothetical protein PHO03_02450 [Candidatus Omnitrophica bacterium]|nr:hypothetical protein [Candidatus Omnitrophota bacterium]
MVREKIPKGIIVFSILIILYSLHGLPTVDFNTYYAKFYPSPEKIILARYIFSIALRIVLLVSGIGILLRRDIFRKIILLISFFTIATVYWKHPVSVFKKVLIWKVAQGILPVDVIPKIDMLAWSSAIICYVIDIGFALCLLCYFTRPKIKKQFI